MATRPHQPPHGHRSTDDGFLPARPGPSSAVPLPPDPASLPHWSKAPAGSRPSPLRRHKGKPPPPLPVLLYPRGRHRHPAASSSVSPPALRLSSLPSPAMASAGGSSGVVGKPRLLSHPLRFALNISPTCRRRRLVSDRTPIGIGCGGRSNPRELATGSFYSVRRADLFVMSAVAACSPKSQNLLFPKGSAEPSVHNSVPVRPPR